MARTRRKPRCEIKRVPRTDATLPECDRKAVPPGLLTRRQLREKGLSPGGHDPVEILRCKHCSYRPDQSCIHPTRAWLWREDLAKPKRVPTLAQEWALDRAMAARQTCPECWRRYYFCLPLRTQGCCDPCHKGYQPSPDTYLASMAPVTHRLAA